MNRCKTCIHYEPREACRNPLFDQGHDSERTDVMAPVTEPYSGAHILVGPDFGCIQHEEKP